MPKFFLEGISGTTAVVTGEDARHICKVLRMNAGEAITLCDMQGMDYKGVIEAAEPAQVTVKILSSEPCLAESQMKVRLYQALPKGDKLEFIVQKAVELGVHEIVPVLTSRCVSRPDEKSMRKKQERLQKIAAEAAKQAGRGLIPQILPLESFAAALDSMCASQTAILCYEGEIAPLRDCLPADMPETLAVMVGSEGGFSAAEAQQAREKGVLTASLGKRILRCETAPLCALTAIFYHFGEF